MNVVKENIRRSLLKRRRSLPNKELKQASKKINAHLINEIQSRDLKKILMYQFIDNEPCINKTIELSWQKSREVYIPKVISREEIIINRFSKDSKMSNNKYGIKESDDMETVEFHEIDVAVLPLVGIDVNGFRLGYGGGYYDRLSNQRSKMAKKPFIIGVGYAFQILEISFAEDHDLKCDSVITEKGVLKF
tara:strand:- start:1065 stop:1637 length:573 start_codon:yes stop_codon:yes gene_type:complete